MCGRYALSLRPAEVRQRLMDAHMPSDFAPEDDDVRHSYNFAPGYHGLVYRADTPDTGAGSRPSDADGQHRGGQPGDDAAEDDTVDGLNEDLGKRAAHYRLQAMKWGLIPFWTKRSPDYGSMLKTINCRDDSLYEDRGMWTSMKRKKRCIVIAQGFYEWLKKNNGKEKIPHFVKRKDEQLMCFAGLWDCVRYEGTDEKLYTYTIITTDSNKQLQFLHDRMPVILDNGGDAVRTWLDPNRAEWSNDLQSLLKPYKGELEVYPVTKDVGKVGNDSPTFIVPLDSRENKNNIANFFGNQAKAAAGDKAKKGLESEVEKVEQTTVEVKREDESRATVTLASTEDNAPKPVPDDSPAPRGEKRGHEHVSPSKPPTSSKKMRSATSNNTPVKSPQKAAGDGSKKITAFFGK